MNSVSIVDVWQAIVANFVPVIVLLCSLYEVIARAYPTIKDISILTKVFKVLLWLSETLNNKKK